MPVQYFVREGPVKLVGSSLVVTELPAGAHYPVKVTVVAWQWGRDAGLAARTAGTSAPLAGQLIQTAQQVENTFYIFNPITLPVTFTTIKGYQKNEGIQVEWNIATESKMKQYEVEKSATGQEFTKVAIERARLNNSSSVSYNWYDAAPFSGNNFYRIKSVDNEGIVKYSTIVNVKIGGKSSIVAYPNPVKDRRVVLQFQNKEKGDYVVQLFNNLGQQVYSRVIKHLGRSATQTLQLGSFVQKGLYQLKITNGTNETITQQLLCE
jgi:hypothetical protein